MLTALEGLDYNGKLDFTVSFKDVNSSWGTASIINMTFDSSKKGMQTFLNVLMIIIKKVKELGSTKLIRRESPNTVVGVSGFEIDNFSHSDQATSKPKEVQKSSMLKKLYKGILNRLHLRQKQNSKKR